MRPDRIVVGEVRGGEALDMLQALNTGHDGSLTTVHANGTAEALTRIETLVLLADVGLPLPAVRAQIFSAIDAVVFVCRSAHGARRVEEIAELRRSPDGSDAAPIFSRINGSLQLVGSPIRPPRCLSAGPWSSENLIGNSFLDQAT
jgi:pilus assembly protein CpaF